MDIADLRKIVVVEFDEILTTTVSHEPVPAGMWDMKLRLDVLDKLRALQPRAVMVVSSQLELALGNIKEGDFQLKLSYAVHSAQEYLGRCVCVMATYCAEPDGTDSDMKPQAGMPRQLLEAFNRATGQSWKPEDCVLIGYASREVDRQYAQDFGCGFIDCNDFLQTDTSSMRYKIVDVEECRDTPLTGIKSITNAIKQRYAWMQTRGLNPRSSRSRYAVAAEDFTFLPNRNVIEF